MGAVNYVSGDAFEADVIQSEIPVLVDFTADWCGPCKMMAPMLAELAQEWEGKIKVLKLDVDENKDTAVGYGVMGIPTLMLFVNGEVKERLTGYKPKKILMKKFTAYL